MVEVKWRLMKAGFICSRNLTKRKYFEKPDKIKKIEYCRHISAAVIQSSLSSHDKIKKCLNDLGGRWIFSTLQPIPLKQNVASLSLIYRYFPVRQSSELHVFFPPVHISKSNSHHAMYTQSTHPSDSFVLRTFVKKNRNKIFSDHFNLNPYIFSWYVPKHMTIPQWNNDSHPITEVKKRWISSVPRWVTVQ